MGKRTRRAQARPSGLSHPRRATAPSCRKSRTRANVAASGAAGGRRDIGWQLSYTAIAASASIATVNSTFFIFNSQFFICVASLRLKVAALDVAYRLEKYRPQLVVNRHVVMCGEIVQPLCRVDVCFRQDILLAHPLEQNRIELFLRKRGQPLPVFGKGVGELVLRRNIHAAYFTTFSSQKPFPGVLFRIRGYF